MIRKDDIRAKIKIRSEDSVSGNETDHAMSPGRLNAIYNAIPDKIFHLGRDGEVLDFRGDNGNLLLPSDRVKGSNIRQIMAKEEAEMVISKINKALDGGNLEIAEYHLIIHGKKHYYETRIVPMNREMVIAIERDISDWKLREEKLQYNSILNNAVSKVSRYLISSKDGDYNNMLEIMGRTVRAGRAYIFQFGDSGKKMDNTFEWCAEGIEPQKENLQNLDSKDFGWWMDHLGNGRNIVLNSLDEIPSDEGELLTFLEKQLIKALVVVPIYTESRKLWGFMGFNDTREERTWSEMELDILRIVGDMLTSDIGRRKMEEDLRRSEELRRAIIDSSRDCIKLLDLQGNLLFMSVGGQRLLEIDDIDSVLGSYWVDFWKDEDNRKARDVVETASGGGTGYFEGYCETMKGDPKWWGVITSPVRDAEGNVSMLLSVSRDITEKKWAEQQLKSERDRYEAIFEATGTATMIINADTTIHDCNGTCERITGYSSEELIGSRWTEYVNEDDLRLMIQRHMGRRDEPDTTPDEYEVRLRDKLGRTRNAILIIRMIPKTSQSIVSLLDITDRKNAEQELMEERDRYETIFQATGTAMLLIEEDTTIIDINRITERIMGYSKEEMVGRSWSEFVHRDDLQIMLERHNARRFDPDSVPSEYEIRIFDKVGNERNAILIAHMLPGTSRSIVSFLDVTKRTKAEHELMEISRNFEDVLERSPDGIIIADKTGKHLYVNDRLSEILGYSMEECLELTLNDITPERNLEIYRKMYKDRIDGKPVQQDYERTVISKSGEEISVQLRATTTLWKGERCGMAFLTDITDRKKWEASLKKEKERAEFYLDLLTHDLGNIHQGLSGALTLMKYNMDNTERMEASLGIANNSVHDSINLTKEVMLLTKMMNEDPRLKKIELKPLITSSIGNIQRVFPEKEIDFELDLEDLSVKAEHYLKEAVFNLLHNAARIQKDPWIKIKTEHKDGFATIHISDKGHGIKDEMKKDLFKKYGIKGERSRTGLGLTIVQALVNRYNGTIEVKDRIDGDPTRGAEFVLEFPLSQD